MRSRASSSVSTESLRSVAPWDLVSHVVYELGCFFSSCTTDQCMIFDEIHKRLRLLNVFEKSIREVLGLRRGLANVDSFGRGRFRECGVPALEFSGLVRFPITSVVCILKVCYRRDTGDVVGSQPVHWLKSSTDPCSPKVWISSALVPRHFLWRRKSVTIGARSCCFQRGVQ